jgi:hypothetical protein
LGHHAIGRTRLIQPLIMALRLVSLP